MISNKYFIPFFLLGSLGLTACQGADKPNVDAELMQQLEALTQSCEVNVDRHSLRCKNKEDAVFTEQFTSGQKDRVASLDTFSVALSGENAPVAVAAAHVLEKNYRQMGDQPGEVSPTVARRIIDTVAQTPKQRASKSVYAAVHAAVLAGETDYLYTMLDNHDYDYAAQNGYENLMYYGRLDVFDKIQALAAGENEKLAVTAFKAPRKIPDPKPEEMAVICPWAQGYMDDTRNKVFLEAGRQMLRCEGEYIDALLDAGEQRLAENHFTRDDYLLFRNVCFTPVKGLIAESGKQAQCERTFAFLESAANNEALDSLARGLALYAIYYQRRDAKTMAVMQKYKNHSDPNINKYANDAIESLVTTYKVTEQG